MFTTKELFSKALMIELPWYIDRMDFDPEKGKLDVWIDFARGSDFFFEDKSLGVSGRFKAYDTTEKVWRHLNFFQYECLLHARIPRVDLGNGRYRLVKAPWEGVSNGFTLLFEALLLEFMKRMPVHQVGRMFKITDNRLWSMMKEYTRLGRADADFSEVRMVGMDETAARRGHDYVTLFVDLAKHTTLFVAEGRDKKVLDGFCEDLKAHGGVPEQVEQVSCDMSGAFIKAVEEKLPNAAIVFDRFHVTKVITDAVDTIRKMEAKENPLLKGSKYLFLSNAKNLSEGQQERLENIRLADLNLKTMRAYRIKEAFQQVYSANSPRMFEKLLKQWYWWATHSRLEPMVKAARTVRRHWQGIINWARKNISNGIIEGFNSIFQATKAKARGYKRFDTIRSIIYLLTAKLDFSKINPYCVTHSF